MKKLFASILFILFLTGLSVYAEAPFGRLSYKADDGLYLFSDGGSGGYDSFGFALSDGEKTVHIYQTGCEFSQPYCAVFKEFPEKELELRQFVYEDGRFIYDTAFYVILQGEPLSVTTLTDKQDYLISELGGSVDKSLYREAEQQTIDRIISSASEAVRLSSCLTEMNTVITSAKNEIAGLKTDAGYYAQELEELKKKEISAISGYVDKELYREAEQLIIDGIIPESIETITIAEDKETVLAVAAKAKEELEEIPTDEKCKENTLLNDEVLYYLDKAYKKLEGFRPSSTKGRLIIKRIVPVIGIVLADGSYGRIYITQEYINGAYTGDVAYVKEKYSEMGATEKTDFKNEIYDRVQDMVVLEFLREYFGL